MGITQQRRLQIVLWCLLSSINGIVAAGPGSVIPRIQWPRIVGGEAAIPGEFPWMVALSHKQTGLINSSYCGGALIAPDWVITAAHCVRGRNPSSLEAVIGRNLLKSEEEGERRAISEIIAHSEFNTETKISDIALVRLEVPSQQQTLSYDGSAEDLAVIGALATVTGWGRTDPSIAGYPETLQKVEVPVVSNEICNAEVAYDGAVTETMLCAGLEEGGKDACTGDSGGPLVIRTGGEWNLAGITSWGEGCAAPNKYGVYTRVFAFRSWIEETMLLPRPNRNPVVDAGPDQVAVKYERIVLKGSGSDPDGDPLTYAWQQVSGPLVNLVDSDQLTGSWIVPNLGETARVRFELTAADGNGGTASDTVEFTILAGQPLAVDSQEPVYAVSRDLVELVTARDETSDWSYSWTQLTGPEVVLQSPNSPVLLFRSPDVGDVTPLEFSLTKTSSEMQQSEAYKVVVSPRSSLVLPAFLGERFSGQQGYFFGIAAMNPLNAADTLRVSGADAVGQAQGKPAEILVGGLAVNSFLISEFSESPETLMSLVLDGEKNPVQGFFLFGTNQLNQLDGVGQVFEEGTDLSVPLPDGEGKSGSAWILNPNREFSSTYQVELHPQSGGVPASQGLLAPGGAAIIPLGNLLGSRSDPGALYLRVKSQRPVRCLVALSSGRASIALSGQLGRTQEELIAPHFFFDSQGGDTWISLVNLETRPLQGTAEAFSDVGELLGELEFEVEASGVFERPVSTFPIAERALAEPVTGYLVIKLGQLGIEEPVSAPLETVGAVSFSGGAGEAWATLPLLTEGRYESTVMHVTQSPASRLFMGLALLNLGDSPGLVRIDAISGAGEPAATCAFLIGSKQRRVGLLDEAAYFGSGFSQIGGHLRIYSDVPLVVYSLVGDYAGKYLAAVESQRLKR